MDDLSTRQREVLDFIQQTIMIKKLPPTYREIGDALNISSTNGVSDHVKALIRKGYIEKPKGRGNSARGLLLTEKVEVPSMDSMVDVPLLGMVAAGSPILAQENYERTLRFDDSLAPSGKPVFALRVRGDSMMDDGILDGDIIIIRKQSIANEGDIVVALVDGEATVKRFFRERNRIRLQPSHPTMRPIYVDSTQDAHVQGVVVAVHRTYDF
jgi:repressor LexA